MFENVKLTGIGEQLEPTMSNAIYDWVCRKCGWTAKWSSLHDAINVRWMKWIEGTDRMLLICPRCSFTDELPPLDAVKPSTDPVV